MVRQTLAWLVISSLIVHASSGFLGTKSPLPPATPKHNPIPPPPLQSTLKPQQTTTQNANLLELVAGHVEEVVTSLTDSVTPGALGRLASVLVLHPLDSMKTRAQVISMQSRRTMETAIIRSRVDYKGVIPAVLGQVPNGLLTCVGYELWKDTLTDLFPKMDARTKTVTSAVLGDLCGHAWSVPAEVLKCQIISGFHSNAGSAVLRLAKQGPGAFYKGYRGQVMRDVPYRALQLVLFDEMSKEFAKRKDSKRLTMGETLCTGALAGSLAAAITTPMDLVKSRLMLSAKSTTFRQVLQSAARMEGMQMFTGSMAPKMIYVGASTAAFFAVYEAARRSGLLQA